jgi:hypothetical protein
LCSTKEKALNNEDKTGIYRIICSKCNANYIGQTKKKMKIRIKEQCDNCNKTPTEEKPMTEHSIENNQTNISLLSYLLAKGADNKF